MIEEFNVECKHLISEHSGVKYGFYIENNHLNLTNF